LLCSSCHGTVKPVVALDIDGTLGDHHGHFQQFAENYVARFLGPDVHVNNSECCYAGWCVPGDEPPVDNPRERYPYDIEFSDWLGMSKDVYRETKLAYRQGGMKRRMPVHEGASELVKNLRNAGAEVWLCTTRPYLRLDNIDPDTREWLRRHDIGYDGLIYGEDKYHQLAEIVGPERVVGVLDDLPEMFDEAAALGLWPIQKINGHSGDAIRRPGASKLLKASLYLAEQVQSWRDERR